MDLVTKSVTFRAPEYFNEYKGYDQSEFTNFNLKAFDCPVVYSTNRNYEYYYLHTLFSMIPRKRSLDIVLIDEVDNMLIDEIESPANISKEINFASAQNIFCIVYATRFLKVTEIAKLLKKEFPNASNFKEEEVELLRNAALEADNKIKDVDYIVKNKNIIIIDQNTGFTMPNSHWQNYVHEMVEIKEYIKPGPASITFCQVTQQSYFNLYNKIAGVTSTIGTEYDEKILNDGYNINCIKVPRNVPSNIEVYYKRRPESIDEIYELVNEEIFTQRLKGRPVLVIWDSKYNADNFKKILNVKKVGMITGENPDDDEIAINEAGKAKTVTIATLAVGRNVTIKQTNESLRAGGLHVIIPMKLSNLRSLEQAVGRTARNGQPGSVLILISEDDLYIQTPQFKQGNNNLVKLELRFAEYIRNHFSWLLCGPGKNEFYGNAKYPFAASYSDIMHILSCRLSLIFRHLTDLNKFQDLSLKMVQTSWGVFFTKLLNDKLNHDNWTYCEKEYIRFIKELNNYMNPNECRSINGAMQYMRTHFQDDSNKDFVIYKGLKISTDNVELILSIGNNNQSSDLIDDSNPTKKKKIFALPKGIKYLKDTYDWIKQKCNENKKSIPNKSILNKTPKIEIENFDIELIKTAMTFAKEAYNCGEFSIGRVIFGCETNELYKPKFYCVEHSNNLFVATKGSSNDVDFLTDISCYEVCEKINGIVYYFHNGFYESAKYILSYIKEFLDRDYENIYFVGHSLAAAVSNVLCFLTKTDEKYKDKKIFSLAFAPPPSMSRVPAFVQDCMYSFINKEDVIPHLSLSNVLNTINLKEIDLETYLDMFIKLFKSSMIKKAQDISKLLDKHKKEIVKTFHAMKDDLHVYKNIGNIFFIGFANSTKLRNYQIDETDLQNTIFIPPSLIAHHFMDDYIKTFEIIKSY